MKINFIKKILSFFMAMSFLQNTYAAGCPPLPSSGYRFPSIGMTLPGSACVQVTEISVKTQQKTNIPLNSDNEYVLKSGYNEKDADDNTFNFICYSYPNASAFSIKEVYGLEGNGWDGYGIVTINGIYDDKNRYKYGVPCQTRPLYHSSYGDPNGSSCDNDKWVIPVHNHTTGDEGFYSGYRCKKSGVPGPGPNITVSGNWQYINMYSIYRYTYTKTATSTITHEYLTPPKPDLNGTALVLKGYKDFYAYDQNGNPANLIGSNSTDAWYRVGSPNDPKYSSPLSVYVGIKTEDLNKLKDSGYQCDFKVTPTNGSGKTLDGINLSDLRYSLDNYPGLIFGGWGGDDPTPYSFHYIPNAENKLTLTLTVNCTSPDQFPDNPIAFNPKAINLYISLYG
jgi:hypothetical protein